MKVTDYLTGEHVPFDVVAHDDAYDAQRLAETLHVSGHEVAKTVLLRADHGYAYVVAVLPATKRIDLLKAGRVLGGSHLELATEVEVAEHCPEFEIGTLPPFGSGYGMRTLVEESLAADEAIFFEGDNHHESIRMRFEDFRRLENPIVARFAED